LLIQVCYWCRFSQLSAVPPSRASFTPTCTTRRKEALQLWCTHGAGRGERRRAACYID
jgi:hypothetical protein